jgi:hypothetical protein
MLRGAGRDGVRARKHSYVLRIELLPAGDARDAVVEQ